MEYTPNYNLSLPDEDDFFNLEHFNVPKSILDEALAGKANKSDVLSLTLTTSNWVGSAAPYTYVLAVTGATSSNLIETITPGTITDEQLISYEVAQIKKITQATDTITLYAYGTKPIIDLPITVIVRGDI